MSCALAWSAPARAAVDYLALREQLEVQRPALRAAMQPFVRAADAAEFPADKPGVAFGKYLDAAWKALDATRQFPEVVAALGKFQGVVDDKNPVQRQALGVLLGDYMQVRYGDDLLREIRALAAFKSFNNVVDRNSENKDVRACMDAMAGLATRLGLQVKNNAYASLLLTLPAAGAGAGAPAVAIYTHADVPRPVEHKWNSPPWELKETKDRWVGLGVYDGKGPTVVNLFALRAMRDAGLRLARPVTVAVDANGEQLEADAATTIAALTPKPAVALSAHGTFPYATGELGHAVARVSSRRGMKSRAGIKPGEFYIWKALCSQGTSTVPMEVRIWVRYEAPVSTDNPSNVMVNQKWRPAIEAYQKQHPSSVYETYIQEDTLHFFAYGNPQHVVHAARAENSMLNAAGALLSLPLFKNSASDVMLWIDKGYNRDIAGKTVGLPLQDPKMGTCRVVPVGFDRLGEEFTVLVDVRWPSGQDAAWVKQHFAASVAAFDKQHGTALHVDWEPRGHEPATIEVPADVAAVLGESFALASGESMEPVPVAASSARLLPATIPFGPEWPRSEPRAHTLDESISKRELQDLCVAYVSALSRLATMPGLGARP